MPSPIHERRALGTVLALGAMLTLSFARFSAAAAVAPLARCEKTKLAASARAARTLLDCNADAVGAGVPVDTGCTARAAADLARRFERAEAKNQCPFVGEAAEVMAVVVPAVENLVAVVSPPAGASQCGSRKLTAAAMRAARRLSAEGKHALTPEKAKLGPALTKAVASFATSIAGAEDFSDCVITGDGVAIAESVDATAEDVVDRVRGDLGTLAAATGRVIGAAARANEISGPHPKYRDLLARQFDSVTLEYELMWGNIESTRGNLLLAPVEQTLAFAEQNGQAVVGAPLVWHLILPSWVNASMTSVELQQALDERIDTLVGAYAGHIATWVVVNEAVNDGGNGLRGSIFLDKLGPGYIAAAFHRAHAADPSAALFYNDYLADGMTAKSDTIYDLVSGLLAEGVPIHGVGLQMHLGGTFAGSGPVVPPQIQQNIQRFVDLGVEVAITEMDVQVADVAATASDRAVAQRAFYHDVIAQCLAVAGCSRIGFWGFTDKVTWIDDYLGVSDTPLLWDASYHPKPAFFGVRDALLGH